MRFIGDIGVVSHHGKFLQSHADGEMHASNSYQDKEETWRLYEIDLQQRTYALLNYYGRYMARHGAGCVRCVQGQVGDAEKWTILDGAGWGLPGYVVFRALLDGHVMGASNEGDDTGCGGEIAATGPASPAVGNRTWPGWFQLWKSGNVVIDSAGGLTAPQH